MLAVGGAIVGAAVANAAWNENPLMGIVVALLFVGLSALVAAALLVGTR